MERIGASEAGGCASPAPSSDQPPDPADHPICSAPGSDEHDFDSRRLTEEAPFIRSAPEIQYLVMRPP
jgi:hypothetical protein